MTKTCSMCRVDRPASEFSKQSSAKDGLQSRCKSCSSKTFKEYKEVDPKTQLRRQSAWRMGHRNHLAEYQTAHRVERAASERKRRQERLAYRTATRLRNRLGIAIRKGVRAGSAVRDLGCSIPELKLFLEQKFRPGMTWENWSRDGWHIDHIKPLASFDLTKREEFLRACHYTNLQPLWAEENLSKGARAA